MTSGVEFSDLKNTGFLSNLLAKSLNSKKKPIHGPLQIRELVKSDKTSSTVAPPQSHIDAQRQKNSKSNLLDPAFSRTSKGLPARLFQVQSQSRKWVQRRKPNPVYKITLYDQVLRQWCGAVDYRLGGFGIFALEQCSQKMQ